MDNTEGSVIEPCEVTSTSQIPKSTSTDSVSVCNLMYGDNQTCRYSEFFHYPEVQHPRESTLFIVSSVALVRAVSCLHQQLQPLESSIRSPVSDSTSSQSKVSQGWLWYEFAKTAISSVTSPLLGSVALPSTYTDTFCVPETFPYNLILTNARLLITSPFDEDLGCKVLYSIPLTAILSIEASSTQTHYLRLYLRFPIAPSSCVGEPYPSIIFACSNETIHSFALLITQAISFYLPYYSLLPSVNSNIQRKASHIVYPPLLKQYYVLGLLQKYRLSLVNRDYAVSKTYPSFFFVPTTTNDEYLIISSKQRSMGRLPIVVYTHKDNQCPLIRCAQPLAAQNGIPFEYDNALLCKYAEDRSLVVLDCRTYVAAMANWAAGKGFEGKTYGKVEFANLGNIHELRSAACNYWSSLHLDCIGMHCQCRADLSVATVSNAHFTNHMKSSRWLLQLSALLSAGSRAADLLSQNTAVVVHCSDNFDRAAQVSMLAQQLQDSSLRCDYGILSLIHREMVLMGHKFRSRNGLGAVMAPVSCGVETKNLPPSQYSILPQQEDTQEVAAESVSEYMERLLSPKQPSVLATCATVQIDSKQPVSNMFSSVRTPVAAVSSGDQWSPVLLLFLHAVVALKSQFPEEFRYVHIDTLERIILCVLSGLHPWFIFDSDLERGNVADVHQCMQKIVQKECENPQCICVATKLVTDEQVHAAVQEAYTREVDTEFAPAYPCDLPSITSRVAGLIKPPLVPNCAIEGLPLWRSGFGMQVRDNLHGEAWESYNAEYSAPADFSWLMSKLSGN